MQQNDENCTEEESPKVTEQLRDFKSLIYHAREVKDGMETLARSLSQRHIDCKNYPINTSLQVNLTHLQEIFAESYDVNIRKFTIAPLACKAALVFMQGMVDQATINGHVIEKLTVPPITGLPITGPIEDMLAYLQNTLLTAATITEVTDMSTAVKRVLYGDTMLIIDGTATILVIATRQVKSRSISKPETEAEVQAANDSFTEDLEVNMTLLRRRVKDPNIIAEKHTVGVRSETDVVVIYYRGIVNQQLVQEVEKRIQNLKNDVADVTNVPSLLADKPYSPFPTILHTERPDKFTTALLAGKVGILVDGNPFGIIAPAAFVDFFRAGEDYNTKSLPSTVIRLLRFISAFFSLTMPALFVAITAYHPALVPTPLTLTLGLAREGVPFPVLLETFLMVFLLEILQEAGIRMPKALGPAVSIVGGLVIGDSAVRAGLISPALVIITSFTAIATFSNTNYQMSLTFRFLRVLLMIAGGILGMFGVMMGLLIIAAQLSMLESFGEPYLGSLIPRNLAHLPDLKDTAIVVPPASRQERPAYLEPEDVKSQRTRDTEKRQE